MATGDQDIASIGLDISSFSAEKMTILRQYISVFNDLSKFDGKIFNPVMGDGLATFNTSIATTNKLIDEMNTKIAAINAANGSLASSTSNAKNSNTELGIATQQYNKLADQAAILTAKLSVATSEQAKQNAAMKLELSEASKALIEEARANNTSIQQKILQKEKTQDYRLEQLRVVETLRSLAKAQDEEAAKNMAEKKNIEREATRKLKQEEIERTKALKDQAAAEQIAIARKEADDKITRGLTGDYEKLNAKIKEQAAIYQNLYVSKGKDNPQTISALNDYKATAGIIEDIDKGLNKSSDSVTKLGTGLTHAFGYLRNIAYILPGIGIAGIFNLAFEAIGEAAEAMGLFQNNELKTIKTNTDLTNSLAEQIEFWRELIKLRNEFYQSFIHVEKFGSEELFKNITDMRNKLEVDRSRGYNQDVILKEELEVATKRFNMASVELNNAVNPKNEPILFNQLIFTLKQRVQEALELYREYSVNSQYFAEYAARGGKTPEGEQLYSKDEAEAKQKENEALAKVAKSKYEEANETLSEYFNSKNDLERKQKEIEKFNSDQDRKLFVEKNKDRLQKDLEHQKAVLDNDRKFFEDRRKAINQSFEDERKIAITTRISVTGILEQDATKDVPLNPNVGVTQKEIEIAYSNQNEAIERARVKRDKDLDRNQVEFYQRMLLSITEFQKDEIEMSALKDERIFLNETKSLDERLNAYEKYIIKKQQIKDLEYTLSIQKGATGPDKENSLTDDEEYRILVHRDTQKFNIQVDTEKKIYDIVKQYMDKRLKEVVDFNSKEDDIDKAAYAKELRDNNERFKNRIFEYEAFKKNKEFIDKKYGVIFSLEKEIEKEENAIKRIKAAYEEILKLKKESDLQLEAKEGFKDLAKKEGTKDEQIKTERDYDTEKGRNKALEDSIEKARKELEKAQKGKDENEIKAAKAKYDQLIQFEKEYLQVRKQIEDEAWKLAGVLINQNVEAELESIERVRKNREEQYSLNQKAIEDSSLDIKNKTALEIQLSQQKLEKDKAAEAEERRIKHDAAVRDRDLNAAHILWNTAESVSAALKLPPPAGEILAGERAILGGLQLAQVLATPIPAYKEGAGVNGRPSHPGGLARFAENNIPEIVHEPGKQPYLAITETVKYLPENTKVIPINNQSPVFDKEKPDNSWEQTRFLANQIKKNGKEIKNVFKPTIIVDMSFEFRKKEILGN